MSDSPCLMKPRIGSRRKKRKKRMPLIKYILSKARACIIWKVFLPDFVQLGYALAM